MSHLLYAWSIGVSWSPMLALEGREAAECQKAQYAFPNFILGMILHAQVHALGEAHKREGKVGQRFALPEMSQGM